MSLGVDTRYFNRTKPTIILVARRTHILYVFHEIRGEIIPDIITTGSLPPDDRVWYEPIEDEL